MQRPNNSTIVSTGAMAGALPIRAGMTLLEMVIAMAIVVVILTAILPAFRGMRNSWDAKQAAAETLQNSRVLIDHLNYNLSKAVRITDVSDSTETNGYIQFKFDDSDVNEWRYEIDDSNLVEFGLVGDLSDLAGPVSQLQFSCYDACDLGTPLDISTVDFNEIRFVQVQTTLTNSVALGQDKIFTTSVYLRAGHGESSDCGLVGWWKLDDASGTIAEDSSDNDNNGVLYGPSWTTGQISGALDFDGWNDYVSLPIGSLISSLTDCTIATWVYWDGGNAWQRIWDFGSGTSVNMFLTARNGSTNTPRFAITTVGWWDEDQTTSPSALSTTGWHHVAVTIDADNHTHKLYLDGSLVAQNTSGYLNPSDLGSTTQNWLARSQYSADPYFNGWLDDVRIYNRVLEPDEIAQLASVLRYEDFEEAKVSSDDTSITISTPDTNEGDLLITAVATDGDTSSSLAPPGGEGWTEIDIDDYSNDVTLGAWWKLAGASESSSHQFTWSGAEQAYGWMMRFTGHNSTNPINASATSGQTSASPTSPAVTATVDNCLILRLGAFDDDDITVDNPGLSGHTAITMDESASGTGAVTYQEFTEAKRSSGSTSITISTPAGVNEGDLLVAAVVTDGDTDDTWPALSPPGGWTEISLEDYSNDVTLGVWRKIAGASEPASYTFTWSGSQEAYGWIMRFTGHHPTSPINDWAADGGQDWSYPYRATCPAVTTTVANCLILRIGGFDDDDITIDDTGLGGGYTDITMDESDWGSDTCSGGAGFIQQSSIGSSGTVTFDLADGEEYRTVTIAIAPAVGGGTVSGGAGYVMQSSAGSSGTSTFSLLPGLPNEAQMLTIAIAPNSDTGCTGSGGGIQP